MSLNLNSVTLSITRGIINPKGHYVYLWKDGQTVFYVGMGVNRRAWNRHHDYIEERRLKSEAFSIWIIRHNLTKKQAHMIERYYHGRYRKTIINKKVRS